MLELARLAVATRPGYPRERLDAVLEQLDQPERVVFFDIEPNPAASRDVRAARGGGSAARRARPGRGRRADPGARALRLPLTVREPWLHWSETPKRTLIQP